MRTVQVGTYTKTDCHGRTSGNNTDRRGQGAGGSAEGHPIPQPGRGLNRATPPDTAWPAGANPRAGLGRGRTTAAARVPTRDRCRRVSLWR